MASTSFIIRILLVDDDLTYLPITISMLHLFDYQVFIAKSPLEALSALQMHKGSLYFDLVFSDLRMSMMNAFEFRNLVDQHFNIPVILMSGEHKRSVLFRGLTQNGLPLFIDKPPSAEDLMNIRKYVMTRRRAESLNNNKRRLSEDGLENEQFRGLEYHSASYNKKPKLVWTRELHHKFLKAVNAVGFHRAVPKKILQYMNVPGLTRENVASHLQKYRVYLKQLCQANSAKRTGMVQNWDDAFSRCSLSWPQFPNDVVNNNTLADNANASNNAGHQERGEPSFLHDQSNAGLQARATFSNMYDQSNPVGQQAMPGMCDYGGSASSMPFAGTFNDAFQGPNLTQTTPKNNVIHPANILGGMSSTSNVAGLSHFTRQATAQGSFMPVITPPSSTSMGPVLATHEEVPSFMPMTPPLPPPPSSLSHDLASYGELQLPITTTQTSPSFDVGSSLAAAYQETQSFMPMMLNNNHTNIDRCELANAVMQFYPSHHPITYSGDKTNHENNQGLTHLQQTEYGGSLNDLTNGMSRGNMSLPEQGNQNVVHSNILNDDTLDSFLDSIEQECLNNGQIPENHFVEKYVTMPQVESYIPANLEVPAVKDAANDVPQFQNNVEQISNSGVLYGSTVPFQECTTNNLEDFYLDGSDEVAALLLSFDVNTGGKGQLSY